MKFTFKSNQLALLNILVFDGDLNLENIQNAKVTNDGLELCIERREFENVRRKKFLLWTRTILDWKKSSLVFVNVKSFQVVMNEKLKSYTYSISDVILKSPTQVDICTNEGLTISITFFKDPLFQLIDTEKSIRNERIVLGSIGFTKGEWENFLDQECYTPEI